MSQFRGMTRAEYDEAMARFAADCRELARRMDEPTIRVGRTSEYVQGSDEGLPGCIQVIVVLAIFVLAGVVTSVIMGALMALGWAG